MLRNIDLDEISDGKLYTAGDLAKVGCQEEIMVSYIGDDDDIIATYQDLAKEYSISQPEFWQSTETDMMFIVWGLVAILMIVLNMIVIGSQIFDSSSKILCRYLSRFRTGNAGHLNLNAKFLLL